MNVPLTPNTIKAIRLLGETVKTLGEQYQAAIDEADFHGARSHAFNIKRTGIKMEKILALYVDQRSDPLDTSRKIRTRRGQAVKKRMFEPEN